ncbi:RNA ligase family protein [Microtetraspora sp. AC03309]|uniref:RNA ligase family protein n=1 Tax=Microtetraspora sp. AC03309 TaxID=2779376 RepID=UPI0027DEF551|nr:RNA ligase family protein [Microtetraspora sp. AC03309]
MPPGPTSRLGWLSPWSACCSSALATVWASLPRSMAYRTIASGAARADSRRLAAPAAPFPRVAGGITSAPADHLPGEALHTASMRHLAYPKIPTAERSGGTVLGGPWVATEKVHGAQMVIAYDGRNICVGKRKAWLRSDEPFFGWQLLRGRFEKVANAALARGDAAVRVFGELYGGHYPHCDVTPIPGVTPVQTGIWYSPEIRFALFDVLRHKAPGDPGVFLAYADVASIAADADLDVVPLLARGSRSDLDTLPGRFPSRVPQALGLPGLPDNVAEGIVLRPDSPLSPEHRPILKLKIEEFDERRFDQSRPWDPEVILAPEELGQVARAMVNEPRLASARSKVGPSALDELLDEVVLDIMVDLSDAFPAAMGTLGGDDEAYLQASIRTVAARLEVGGHHQA